VPGVTWEEAIYTIAMVRRECRVALCQGAPVRLGDNGTVCATLKMECRTAYSRGTPSKTTITCEAEKTDQLERSIPHYHNEMQIWSMVKGVIGQENSALIPAKKAVGIRHSTITNPEKGPGMHTKLI
jgi:hypothetical protein